MTKRKMLQLFNDIIFNVIVFINNFFIIIETITDDQHSEMLRCE